MEKDLIALITAIGTLIGLVATSLLQYFRNKSDARIGTKKTDTDAAAQLIDKALAISKQEIDTLRTVNVDIKEQLTEAHKTIEELDKKVEKLTKDNEYLSRSNEILSANNESLTIKVKELEAKINNCIAKLNENGIQ